MLPSLFDIQVNGFAGVDFQQIGLTASRLRHAVDRLAAHQTRRIFLTLITDTMDALCHKLAAIEQIRAQDEVVRDVVCGYHIEGPWLSPEPGYCGAHNPGLMGNPDPSAFDRLQRAAGGNIRLVTLAPELAGSREMIRHLVAEGVQVSLGHTRATEADIDIAIEAGARFCTHLGNGIPSELPRHDNVMQRLLARDELFAFFIPDGIHLPPHVLKNLVRAKPAGKALFTTDCMSAAGAPPGRYTIGPMVLEVGADRIVREPGKTNFAGSALAPDEGVQNVARWLRCDPDTARAGFSTTIAEAFAISLPSHPMSTKTILTVEDH